MRAAPGKSGGRPVRARGLMPVAALLAAMLVCGALPAGAAEGAHAGFVAPAKKDKCPVCGMFVAGYPAWLAETVFAKGYAVFDGPKDMFRFLFDPGAFLPGGAALETRAVFVTDYYTLDLIDGKTAFYVYGSDVYGPMGKELIPFADRKDAEGFLQDHKGQKVLTFDMVKSVMAGLLE